jgi:hypothetical protein
MIGSSRLQLAPFLCVGGQQGASLRRPWRVQKKHPCVGSFLKRY